MIKQLTEIDVDSSIIKSLENNFRAYQIIRKHCIFNRNAHNKRGYGVQKNIISNFKTFNLQKQADLLTLYWKETKDGLNIFEKKQIRNQIKQPSKINRLTYGFFKVKAIKIGNQYKEQLTSEVTIKTDFYFWKIPMLIIWSYFMIQKWIHYFVYMAFYSQLSFKCVFYTKSYARGFIVNPNTGQLLEDNDSKVDSITSKFRKIKEEALDRIEQFENEPDVGLLGKSIVRIFNRMENYIWKYFIVGFIFVNIFMRIAVFIFVIFFPWVYVFKLHFLFPSPHG